MAKQKSTWKPRDMLNWPMARPVEEILRPKSRLGFTFTLTQQERDGDE